MGENGATVSVNCFVSILGSALITSLRGTLSSTGSILTCTSLFTYFSALVAC